MCIRDRSQIPSKERSSIVTAQLDNSYSIQQGDIVVAAGRLYGQNKTVDYGMVSGISTKSGVDNSYEIISTGLDVYKRQALVSADVISTLSSSIVTLI